MAQDEVKMMAQVKSVGKQYLMTDFKLNSLFKALPGVLEPAEKIIDIIRGDHGLKDFVVVATDKRIMFVAKPLIGGLTVKENDYSKIASIAFDEGFLWSNLNVNLKDGSKLTLKVLVKGEGKPFVEKTNKHLK